MNALDLNITGFSTALFSTWLFIEPWRLLFDAGDGVSAGLLQKSRKVETIAVTHPDRDHLMGLPQLLQLNGRPGLPRVLYPRNAGSFPAMASFLGRFDPQTSAHATWVPVAPGDVQPLGGGLALRTLPNSHWLHAPDREVKCVGYTVQETKVVLREELRGKAQVELDAIRASQGKSALLTSETKDLLTFTGDTPIVDASVWGRPLVLIHEATFLDEETASANRTNRHSHLAAVIDVALSVAPQALVLTHFSSRYEKEQIVTRLTAEASSRRVPFPIWMIGPAELVRDVFRTAPAWQP